MNTKIQERLRKLREEAGISQEKLASILGVTRMTLAGYELGRRPPDSEFIVRACNYFGCTPDYIFGISYFKNNEQYQNWISSSNTLCVTLGMLTDQKRSDIVTALNWLLKDNFVVNRITSDEDYLVEKFTNLILSFTEMFQNFARTLPDREYALDEKAIFNFYKSMDKNRAGMINIINTVCNDLFEFLMSQAEKAGIEKD